MITTSAPQPSHLKEGPAPQPFSEDVVGALTEAGSGVPHAAHSVAPGLISPLHEGQWIWARAVVRIAIQPSRILLMSQLVECALGSPVIAISPP